MYKKILVTTALAAVLAVGLCACGQSQSSSAAASSAASSASSAAASSTASSAASSDASASSAASSATSASSASATQFATMEDVFAVASEEAGWEHDGKELIYTAHNDNEYVRVVVDLTDDAKTALDNANHEFDKVKEALAPLAVKKQEVYQIPGQSELDSAIGKTGAELAAEGYVYDSIGISGPDSVGVGAAKDPFFYMVMFDGHVDDMDTPDVAGAVSDFKVTSMRIMGLSNNA